MGLQKTEEEQSALIQELRDELGESRKHLDTEVFIMKRTVSVILLTTNRSSQ